MVKRNGGKSVKVQEKSGEVKRSSGRSGEVGPVRNIRNSIPTFLQQISEPISRQISRHMSRHIFDADVCCRIRGRFQSRSRSISRLLFLSIFRIVGDQARSREVALNNFVRAFRN